MLPGDGAALERRLQPISYEDKEQLSAVHLLHALQSLLLGHRGTQSRAGIYEPLVDVSVYQQTYSMEMKLCQCVYE